MVNRAAACDGPWIFFLNRTDREGRAVGHADDAVLHGGAVVGAVVQPLGSVVSELRRGKEVGQVEGEDKVTALLPRLRHCFWSELGIEGNGRNRKWKLLVCFVLIERLD